MIRQKPYFLALLALFFLSQARMVSASALSADYSQAVSLFKAQNFQAALPLFQQIVQDEPSNAKAYSYLGSCQGSVGYLRGEALNYYISNRLSPDPALKATADKVMGQLSLEDSDWVDQHLDNFSLPGPQAAPTAAPATPVPATAVPPAAPAAPSTLDDSEAVSLFAAQDYQGALPLFQKLVQEDPGNAKAYSRLGSCEENLGDIKGAALAYYLSDRLSPNPQLKSKADQLMHLLSPAQQNSVLDQLASWKNPSAPMASSTPPPSSPSKPASPFGLRFASGISFFNLADFQSDLKFRIAEVQGFQAANPTYYYRLQSSISSNNEPLEVEPYLKLNPDVELGLVLGYWPSISYTYLITDVHPQYFVNSEFDMDSFELLVTGRVYFLGKDPKGFRLFFEPSFGVQPINLHRTYGYANTSGTPSADQTGESLGSTTLESVLQLGASFPVAPNLFLSFSAGYEFSASSGFEGTWSDSAVAGKNGAQGSLRLYTSPTTGQSSLTFVPDDPNLLSAFGEDANTIAYSRPLSIDQGGFRSDLDLNFNF